MGAGASTQGDATKQVFTSESPVTFSQDLIDSLQASPETNSTRQKSLDLHIQQRVAAELARLQEEQSSLLEAARKKISSETSDSDSKSSSSSSSSTSKDSSSSSSLLNISLPSISPKNLIPSSLSSDDKKKKDTSSKSVNEEIEKLKKALGERKVMKELPKEVETARQGVISCLRLNDRQSLDCWQEVEIFKREVRKLEEQFVGKVL